MIGKLHEVILNAFIKEVRNLHECKLPAFVCGICWSNAANTVHQSNSMTPHKWLPVFWSQQVSISFSSFCTPVMNWAAPTVDNVLRWIIVVCNYFVLKEKTTEVYDGISFDKLDNKLQRTEQIFFFFFCFWFLKDINDSTTKLDFLFPRDFHLRF